MIRVFNAGLKGETYNVGTRNERRNIEIAEQICIILDEMMPKNVSYSKQITYVQDRPGHDFRYAIDPKKIESELSWRPSESFESGLRKTVAWYLSQ
ncbi:MAG: hypothetical protein EOO20_21910 [Chryseobacterium sp.]|nr:MAG: hypothetical protein EOO20_21910 [Chryseobacterium sp.]